MVKKNFFCALLFIKFDVLLGILFNSEGLSSKKIILAIGGFDTALLVPMKKEKTILIE